MIYAGYTVMLPEETDKRIRNFLGGCSHDCDEDEIAAFVFSVAQEYYDRVYCYDGDLVSAVEYFDLKAEIIKAIASRMSARRLVETTEEE